MSRVGVFLDAITAAGDKADAILAKHQRVCKALVERRVGTDQFLARLARLSARARRQCDAIYDQVMPV